MYFNHSLLSKTFSSDTFIPSDINVTAVNFQSLEFSMDPLSTFEEIAEVLYAVKLSCNGWTHPGYKQKQTNKRTIFHTNYN